MRKLDDFFGSASAYNSCMRIARLTIKNFRGILNGELLLPDHAVLVGDNNSGKSSVLEAIDLVLGPERLSRRPVIDEHDFYAGGYLDAKGEAVPIEIEVVVVGLTDEQQSHFRDHNEWWDSNQYRLLDGPPAARTDVASVTPALRVGFRGEYDKEEDDFIGKTFYASPEGDDGEYGTFRTADKRKCGFLFLRALRTGSRALSLERGSLLDIILKLQDKRLQMWEEVLVELRRLPVAEQKEIGLSEMLSKVEESVKTFVPADWGVSPHMRVSDLTREGLRKTLTVFLGTGAVTPGGTPHSAPFQHQGTGTINALVLALLSMIADLRQNVIFAMEEPEIAIPPHTQRRIVETVRARSAQAIFTSHSPYVLEEFDPSQILSIRREGGELRGVQATYPPGVKPKRYREEMRRRFCEALLAKRVLIAEGRTEYDAIPAAARRLQSLDSKSFATLESLGIAIVNAETDSQIAPLAQYFCGLGKEVFSVFDKQNAADKAAIEATAHHPFESPEAAFETLLVNHSAVAALRRFGTELVAAGEWPTHLPQPGQSDDEIRLALRALFESRKGDGGAADFLSQCAREEMPPFVVDVALRIRDLVGLTEPAQATVAPEPIDGHDGGSTAAAT